MKTLLILVRVLGLLTMLVCLVLMYGFLAGRANSSREWDSKMSGGSRDRTVVRGLMDSMIRFRGDSGPSFVPQSGWDNPLCAANIIGGVNFLLGEERLEMASAWEFSSVNAGKLKLVYDRSEDFAVEDSRIVEVKDRNIWLSRILETVGHGRGLTSDRMYVVGYHFHRTMSDRYIIEAGGDLNSHLMLILGRDDGTWWGYHMIHNKPRETAFHVDDLGDEVADDFDIVYIWEILGTDLPVHGAPVRLVQDSPSFEDVGELVGWTGQGVWDYRRDTAVLGLFGEGDHFPTVVSTSGLQTLVPTGELGGFHGAVLGTYAGVAVRQQLGGGGRSGYGLSWQCVEFVNRFYSQNMRHRNMQRTGHADSYWYGARGKDLVRFKNGSLTVPCVGDILIFDPEGAEEPDDPGHIAVVMAVNDSSVCVVQQNTRYWNECLQLERIGSGWWVRSSTERLPVVGWSRRLL